MTCIFNRCISKRDLPAFIFIMITGTLNHFLYDWTGNPVIALFCPVNESTWEHLKLLFFPFLVWCLLEYFFKRPDDASSYFYCRFLSIICGMLWIVTLFYTYTGIIGQSFLVLDILIFATAILFTLCCITWFTEHVSFVPPITVTFAAWTAVLLCFFIFTCFPPEIPLFFSPGA